MIRKRVIHPPTQNIAALRLTVAQYVDNDTYGGSSCGLTFQVAQFIDFGRQIAFVV